MTNEEALVVRKQHDLCSDRVEEFCFSKTPCKDCEYNYDIEEYEEAIDLAFGALEKIERYETNIREKIELLITDLDMSAKQRDKKGVNYFSEELVILRLKDILKALVDVRGDNE